MPVQVRRAVLCGGVRLLGRRVAMSVGPRDPVASMMLWIMFYFGDPISDDSLGQGLCRLTGVA